MSPSGRTRLALAATVASVALLAAPAPAAQAAVDPVYTALRSARPKTIGTRVEGLVLERDAYRITFESGSFHLLAPVEGRVVGAVFVGQGHYVLTPATDFERRHLAVSTEEKGLGALADRFDRMVLLFTDRTAEEIRAKAGPAGGAAVDAKPEAAFEKLLKRERKELHTNLHLRLLQDLLDREVADGVFLAYVEGKKYAPALLVVDPRGVEATGLGSLLGGEETGFYSLQESHEGFWYLSHRADELARGPAAPHPLALDGLHYAVDSRIRKNADLEGTTVVRLRAVRGGVRVVPLGLAGKLRILEAGWASGEAGPGGSFEPAAWIQEDAKEDPDAAVVLPKPLAAGEVVSIRLVYKGDDVLLDEGDGNFAVGARSSWYPNVGAFSDPATFDLTFRVPRKNQVVAVGTPVETREEGELAVSRWKTDRAIRVAGFNYGRFKKLERVDKESGFTVQVFTNPGQPDIARALKEVVEAGRFDTDRMAESALVDGINAARTGLAYFGPLPATRYAISQQSQWGFGQSWPQLVFLPYLAFLDSTTRFTILGPNNAGDFVDQVGYHELAHQWWGHLVGWGSYRDQWLSEGFAEFTAALVLQHTAGTGKYNEFWEKAAKRILERPQGSAFRNDEVGPITQGFRLASRRTPGAYTSLVYSKGAYVLHMLRMMMWDVKSKSPDARFIEMMKDFATRYADRSPTTADFQKVVEAHLTPELDLAQDGKMDWFFGQWVHGTEIPKLESKVDVQDLGDGRYRLSGEIRQSGVSDGFRCFVPLYVEFGKGEIARVGAISTKGNVVAPVNGELKLPKKPRRVFVNAMHDVLSRD